MCCTNSDVSFCSIMFQFGNLCCCCSVETVWAKYLKTLTKINAWTLHNKIEWYLPRWMVNQHQNKDTQNDWLRLIVCDDCCRAMLEQHKCVCVAHYAGQDWMLQSSSWFLGSKSESQRSAGTVAWESFSTHSQSTLRLPGECTHPHTHNKKD